MYLMKPWILTRIQTGLPLENLKLEIKTDGVVKTVDALLLIYFNDDGLEIPGAKEQWIEIVNYIINDLKWLLGLPFHRFWSNIVFSTSILDTLVSFLQDAPPFYALENFPNSPEMLDLLETLSHHEKPNYVKDSVQFASLVSNVKDILHQLDEGFIKETAIEDVANGIERLNMDDSTEVDLRPFTIGPRIFREKQKIEIVSESESEDEDTKMTKMEKTVLYKIQKRYVLERNRCDDKCEVGKLQET
ncbi:hypothetical protein K0M31_015497 [Melipona bicolor]|uniref:Uncharacterized protein n=1 Tax=Melipona bicolor TaxID=60889 RepID=A0AA40FFG5_9HYME|nr:hypothetical protein K0M31_015497 [Melipona bicolor]